MLHHSAAVSQTKMLNLEYELCRADFNWELPSCSAGAKRFSAFSGLLGDWRVG